MSETQAVGRPIDSFRTMLERSSATIAAVLPRHLTPERIIKIATVAISRTPALMECTPASVVQSVVLSSQLGLEPGGPLGAAYLVPYKNGKTGKMECQFIPGYRGLIDLARRSGQVQSVEAHCVYDRDEWEYANTHEGVKLRHVPFWDGDRGQLKRVYAIGRLKDTTLPVIEVMSKSDVDKIRAKSKARDNGPWVSDYDEMARKTVVRRLVKYLPMSVELTKALELEDRAEGHSNLSLGDMDFVAAEVLEDGDAQAPATRTEQLKNAMPEPTKTAMLPPIKEIESILVSVYGDDIKRRNEAVADWTQNMCATWTELKSAPDEIVIAALPNARKTAAEYSA